MLSQSRCTLQVMGLQMAGAPQYLDHHLQQLDLILVMRRESNTVDTARIYLEYFQL